jgi:hypothetical protein
MIAIVSIIICIVLFFFKKLIQNSYYGIYALSLVVSVVGINIHFGITMYLSRLVLIFFLLSLIIRKFDFLIKPIWIQIPIISIVVQLISTLISNRIEDSFREVLIYLFCAFIFWFTIMQAKTIEIVLKSIKLYLLTGLIQAIYGIYQLFGYTRNWPTYQTLLAGIPMANDRTENGYFYTGTLSAFRAIGFFSTDVSHFAGYMAGVLILTLSFIINNRKEILPYVIFILGILSLFFSLSRSGIAAFFLFGLPTLFITLKWQKLLPKFNVFNFKLLSIITLISIFFIFNPSYTEDLPNPIEILSSRFEDVFDQQENGSMGDHVLTRKLGLDAFETHPILGVGSGVNANAWFSDKYQAEWAGSHSYHIDRLGQTGIIGLLIEWLLMFYILKYMLKGIRVRRYEKFHKILLIGLFSTYVTIILGNFLYYYYMNDFVWFIMGLGVAMTRLILIEQEKYIIL